MVMAGVVHYSSAAFAAEIQVSQDSQFANQTSVSQQTETDQASANNATETDSSVQNNTNSSAEQQQMASTTDESNEPASSQ